MGKLQQLNRSKANARESLGANHKAPSDRFLAAEGKMKGLFPAAVELAEIAVGRIDRDPAQPRKTFDPGELTELAATIAEWGQLQPAWAWWDAKADRYRLAFGERRWRAAQQAGRATLLCVILPERPDPTRLRLIRLIENAARAAVPALEEAAAFAEAMEAEKWSARQLADKLGLDHSKVSDRLALLKLHAGVLELVESGDLDPSTAREIARLEDPVAQSDLAARAATFDLTRDQVRAEVRKQKAPPPPPPIEDRVCDGHTPAAGKVAPTPAPPDGPMHEPSDAWRSVPLKDLDDFPLDSLVRMHDAGVRTVGDLSDTLVAGGRMEDLGLSDHAVAEVFAALDWFWDEGYPAPWQEVRDDPPVDDRPTEVVHQVAPGISIVKPVVSTPGPGVDTTPSLRLGPDAPAAGDRDARRLGQQILSRNEGGGPNDSAAPRPAPAPASQAQEGAKGGDSAPMSAAGPLPGRRVLGDPGEWRDLAPMPVGHPLPVEGYDPAPSDTIPAADPLLAPRTYRVGGGWLVYAWWAQPDAEPADDRAAALRRALRQELEHPEGGDPRV